MELNQIVQHGFESHKRPGVIIWGLSQESEVSTQNRSRIIAREEGRGGRWEHFQGLGRWFVFPSHPDVAELSDHLTRIMWERV
jgi:hypothetical protein